MNAIILLADGFEDIEALATRDVLLRGGVTTFLVSINDSYIVKSSHGLDIKCDYLLTYNNFKDIHHDLIKISLITTSDKIT